MTGRPTSLTDDVQAKILEYISEGNYLETCAKAVGVTRQTLHNWKTWGAEGRQPYAAFFDALQKAEALAEITAVRRMYNSDKIAIGLAWILERRWPTRWSGPRRAVAGEAAQFVVDKLKDKPELANQVLDVFEGEDGASPVAAPDRH